MLGLVALLHFSAPANAQSIIDEFPIPTTHSNPYDITAGPDGNVWFVEAYGNKISKITPQGVITEYPIPTHESNPLEIITGPDDHLWFNGAYTTKIGRFYYCLFQ